MNSHIGLNKSSAYMHWAKTASQARWNLATSGVKHYPLKDLDVAWDNVEINGLSPYGYEPLLESLAAKCGVPTSCLAVAIGTSMANHLAMATLLNPGDHVLIEHPTYEPILAVARYLQATVHRLPRSLSNNFQIDPDDVQQRLNNQTKVIVITNLHNPSGVLIERERLEAIGKIADRWGAKILIDEVYLECLFPTSGTPYSAFHPGGPFITTASLTKAYGLSGLRCGWILGEPQFITQCKLMSDLFYATPPHIPEVLSVIALNKLSSISGRAKQLLEVNRKLLVKFVDATQTLLDVVLPEFGTVVFPKLRAGNAEKFVKLLREKYDTSVVPGSFFEMPEHFRIGIGGESDSLEKGLSQITKALKNPF